MPKPKTKCGRLQHEVEKYVDLCLSGKRPSGRLEKLALQRHNRDLSEQSDRREFFSWGHATHHLDFFPLLVHPKGSAAGKPFELVTTHKTMLALLYGWRRVPDLAHQPLLRRFREAYLSEARGNGKSPKAAAIALNGMVADLPPEPGAENVCVATTRAQASKYVWSQARDFIKKVKALRDRCRTLSSEKVIEFECDDITSTFGPLGSDSNNLDGGNYHIAVLDELHAWREQHRGLLEVVSTAMGKRLQDLLVYITTAGSDRSTLWKEVFDYARKVLENLIDDRQFYAYILSCDIDDDPFDESTWIKANPLLGISVQLDKFRAMALKAKNSPAKLNEFDRYKRNLLVSDREKPYPPELTEKGGPIDLARLKCVKCTVGIDLGWRDDLAAAAACFELTDGTHKPFYAFQVKAWMPSESERRHQMPFEAYIRSGLITLSDGETNDDDDVYEWVEELNRLHGVNSVAADGNNFRSLLNRFHKKLALKVYEFPQNQRKYNEPVRKLQEFYRDRRVLDGGNLLLRWALDNVALRKDSAGYVMPDKDASIEKIDPACSVLMALSETLYSNEAESRYEEHGIRTL